MARAVGDDSNDEFIQALRCSIHFGVIRQPKALLPCLHTFCRDCLVRLVKGSEIKCPICRRICLLSDKGVDDLPNNIALQTILDTLCVSCQKTPSRSTCPCCLQQLCDKCKIMHASNLQTKITGKKQNLRNIARVLTRTSQSLNQSKSEFLSQIANCKSEIKSCIIRAIKELKRRGAQLEAELNSFMTTEADRINQYQENIMKQEQEIQVALQRLDAVDASILENLEKLLKNSTVILSTMAVSPATVSCNFDEQLIHDVCMGFGQIEYKPPQPGSGAPTDLLQYQPVTIDYQAIGTPRKVFGQKGSGQGQFDQPTNLAVSPVSGNLVLCDNGNSRVQIFTPDGTFLTAFGSKGKGEGQFIFGPFISSGGVTVTDRDEIVIADSWNHRLQLFDEAGGFIRVIGSKGSAPGQFNFPTGVTCDNSHLLYICDYNNQRVQVMTMEGSVVRVIAASDVPGGRWNPGDIAMCPDGDLVVADPGTGLQVFSATGQHKATIPCGKDQHVECRYPAGVAVDPQGHILVTDGVYDSTHKIYVVEKSGKLICNLGGGGTSPAEFVSPRGVAVTQDGGIIVVEYGNNRVQIF